MAPNATSPWRRVHSRGQFRLSSLLLSVGAGALIAAVAAAGFLALRGHDAGATARLRQTPVVTDERQVEVDVVDNDFAPRQLTVRKGATVTWRSRGGVAHTVTDTAGRFDSGAVDGGDEYQRTFLEAGTYDYYCRLHHAMLGTLVVTE